MVNPVIGTAIDESFEAYKDLSANLRLPTLVSQTYRLPSPCLQVYLVLYTIRSGSMSILFFIDIDYALNFLQSTPSVRGFKDPIVLTLLRHWNIVMFSKTGRH